MAADYTKKFKRESESKALLAVDIKALEKFEKQKAAMKQLKLFQAALTRINKLEETVEALLKEVEQLKSR